MSCRNGGFLWIPGDSEKTKVKTVSEPWQNHGRTMVTMVLTCPDTRYDPKNEEYGDVEVFLDQQAQETRHGGAQGRW